MAQTTQLGKTATSIFTEKGVTHVQYHATRVVSFSDKKITFRTGGWRTVTTKLRMNQASNQFSLGWRVCQKKGDWFVSYYLGEGIHILRRPFDTDEITLLRYPEITPEQKQQLADAKHDHACQL